MMLFNNGNQKYAAKPYYLTPETLTCYKEEFKDQPVPEALLANEVKKGVYVIQLPSFADNEAAEQFKNFLKSLPHGDEILAEYNEMQVKEDRPCFR